MSLSAAIDPAPAQSPYWSRPLFAVACSLCGSIIEAGAECYYYPSTGAHTCKDCASLANVQQLTLF